MLSSSAGYPLVNINLELSRMLIELTPMQRSRQLRDLLDDYLRSLQGQFICLDNTEMLFSRDFTHDPLALFQLLSRDRALIVAWNGEVNGSHLIYAAPQHPEYRQYKANDLQYILAKDIDTN